MLLPEGKRKKTISVKDVENVVAKMARIPPKTVSQNDKKTLSKDLVITAETSEGIIMGVKHKKYNIHGVQFHPESIKTPVGLRILKNFINYKN